MSVINRKDYNVEEYPFVKYDDMIALADKLEAILINHFTCRGYFTLHTDAEECQIWYDINQDDRPTQLEYSDGEWHNLG